MKLHTDFRDYYDHAVGYGTDTNVHYNRFMKEVEIRIDARFDFPRTHEVGLLGYCGKIYPFYELKKYDRNFNDECDFDGFKVVERFYAFSREEYDHKKSEWGDYFYDAFYVDHSRKVKLKQFFIDWNYESDEIFLEHKVPLWTIKLDAYQNKGLLNPKLKHYGFDRIKDALTAFQDISMYVANILVEQKEIAAVEDKFRIEQHGFDAEKSFRKEKKSRQ